MRLDRYKIVREIAQGSCGKTFLAQDSGLPSNRFCVIKQFRPTTRDPQTTNIIKERFIVEARVLEKLGREINNIPELYELIIEGDEIYLVQEWVEGKTIEETIETSDAFSAARVITIMLGILDILRKVYPHGVIHRDINPKNIILRAKDSEPVLIDFGLVKEVIATIVDGEAAAGKRSIVVGTRGYIAPEQFQGNPAFASDLYSLGMTAIFMLTGRHPFELADSLNPEIQWIKYAPTIGDDFAAVIDRAIQVSVRNRYHNAADMYDDVRSCLKPSFDSELLSGKEFLAVGLERPDSRSAADTVTSSDQTMVWQPKTVEAPIVDSKEIINLAIELGSRTVIHRDKIGIVVFEPSALAVHKLSGAVQAAGSAVEDLLLVPEANVDVRRPVKNEKIADRKLTATMLSAFIKKAAPSSFSIVSRIVLAVPSDLTSVERRAFIDAAYEASASYVYLVDRATCAAVGAHQSLKGYEGNLIIHVGEASTEIMATSGGRRVSFQSVALGIESMYDALIQYLKRRYNLLIGEQTCAAILANIGSAFPLDEELQMEVTGRNLVEGLPKTITVNDEEAREALGDVVAGIAFGLRMALEQTPPEVSADIAVRGMVLSGVGAQLKNFDKRLSIETGIPASITTDPLTCVVTGAAKTLSQSTLQPEKRSASAIYGSSRTSLYRGVLSLFSTDLAVDIGTANTLAYAKGRGIIVSRSSLVALDEGTNRVEAVGGEAREIVGIGKQRLALNRPVKYGAIVDTEITSAIFRDIILKAHGRRFWGTPRVLITVPSGLTKVELEAFLASAYLGGASVAYLVDQSIAAAIGAGLPVTANIGYMIVNVGASLTEIAVISAGSIVYSRTVRVGGNNMDEDIAQYIKRRFNLLIGDRVAEVLKIELGSAFPLDDELSYSVHGRNIIEGIPKTVTITDEEMREAIADSVSTLMNAVRIALERLPPELAGDIVENGIVLTGGGSLVKNLGRRLSIETGLPISEAEDPIASVVLGAGRLLHDSDLLRQIRIRL